MATQILKIVTERRNVSFAELSRSVEGFDGELGLILNDFNICLWPHLSQAAVDALEELRLAKAIYPKPTSVLVYLADGAVPNMPIARGRRRYKRPHWAPLVFNPGRDPEFVAATTHNPRSAPAARRNKHEEKLT
jgi:hypothetical protein